MIKFWKSAAKGKSGYPVRPPESVLVNDSGNKVCLDTDIAEYENKDDTHIFEKKSKLTITLHDILVVKTAIKYFMQFMETVNKHVLVKCWLELETFKTSIASSHNAKNDSDNNLKLCCTKSLDHYCDSQKRYHDTSREVFTTQRFSWTENSHIYSSNDMQYNKNECSTSSCENIIEHSKSLQKHFCKKNDTNLTEEAISLFKKYVALESPYQLDLPDDVRKSVITNICEPEGNINENCFKPVQDILFNQIENNYCDFQNSPYYIKAQIDILTSTSLSLQDILYNEAVLFYFTEYLEQESCSILLELLMAVMHFRDNLINDFTANTEQAQTDAIILYEKYFSLQATNPIGFPTDIRLNVESDICREEGPLPTCFDLPYTIVFKTLTHYVNTFLESELYYKYLSEMVHSVDQKWPSNHKSHSDCSSEFSISTQNTLLAMGDPFYKKKRNHSVPDMTIDSNQLYNADALWQRKRYDGLSLGRVNSLGRFESKFEPDPDKRDKSVFKKMVSRFVPINTSKVEEEMAWQIAHMIVKDVTDLTMAPPDNDRDNV